jgi:hypothetical protein
MALAGPHLRPVIRGARLPGLADLPRRTADTAHGSHHRRHLAVHRRADPARPAGLAVGRRPAARLGLGARQLRRARLVGRLAASRGQRAARTAREGVPQLGCRRHDDRAGRRRGARARGDARQHLRRRHRHAAHLARARTGDPRHRQPLRRALRGRPGLRQAARTVRDDGQYPARGCRSRSARRVLLLVVVGIGDRSSGRVGPVLHEQLAARAAGRQHDDHLGGHVVDGQHHPAARRHRRDAVAARPWRRRARSAGARARSAARREGHAVDAGNAQVLLRRRRADAAADRDGRDHRALRGRGPVVLRPAARRSAALRRQPHGAPPRGSPPACTSRRCCRAPSRSTRSSASTCCSTRWCSSCSARR